MQGLAGDLGTMSVLDLLLYLGNRGMTGTLVCERGTAKKSLVIQDGVAINAASNDPREYLGQFLINFGQITEDQLTKAFQTQAETRVFLGRILVMIGLVSEETLAQVLSIKIRETALSLCRWREGTFKFARGVLPPEPEGIPVQVPLLDVQGEAEFREAAWEAMLQAFPRGDLALLVDEERAPREIVPGSLDALLFELMRAGQTIEEISLKLHATDFHLYQRLYALYRQQVIAPVTVAQHRATPPPVRPAAPAEKGAEGLLGRAREAMAQGRFVEAEAFAARALEARSGPESLAVLRDAEGRLLESLRASMMAAPHVPLLASVNIDPKKLDLSPQDKYLLSRIDGVRDLKSIVRVAPMRELDALKCFHRFQQRGLIRLR